MNASKDEFRTTHETAPRSRGPRSRLQVELIIASVCLAFGFFVLPALIYGVGGTLFGPYGENKGMGAFYADFFRDLAEPSGRPWIIGLGPLVLLVLLRVIFLGARPGQDAQQEQPNPGTPAETREARRVEPRVGLD